MIEIKVFGRDQAASSDGPHDNEMTRAIAAGIDQAFRLLNYATMRDGLTYPSDVYSVLGELSAAMNKLPQALHQMTQFIGAQVSEGKTRENPDYGRHAGDAEAAYGELAVTLREGSVAATDLGRLLDRAQAAVRGLESTGG